MNLSILFWIFWIDCSSDVVGSWVIFLTFPYNWRSYLIFEVNSPSTTFNKDFCVRKFLSLLMAKSLLFRLGINPFLPEICIFHCWLSSLSTNLTVYGKYISITDHYIKMVVWELEIREMRRGRGWGRCGRFAKGNILHCTKRAWKKTRISQWRLLKYKVESQLVFSLFKMQHFWTLCIVVKIFF